MSIALVTRGRLYPTASSSGEPIIVVRRDHFVAISSEIVDHSSVEVEMRLVDDIAAVITSEDEIVATIAVDENSISGAIDVETLSGDVEVCS